MDATASRPSSQVAPPDSAAGWRALAGSGVLAMFGVSALYGSTFGLFLLPLQQSLGWSRGEIAFSLTLSTLFTPLVAPLTGWIIDKVPLRPLILAGVVLQSLNFAAFSLMQGSVWVYYGLCLALMLTAAGASLLSLAKLAQGWFNRSLGRALGLLFACGGIGGILHPLWTQAVISQFGWRQAFMVMAGLSLLMCGLAALLFVRERDPAARRGRSAAQGASPPGATAAAPSANGPGSMAAFLRDAIWWKLALFNMLFALGVGAIFMHFAALLQDRGATPGQAALAMSLVGLGGLTGNLLAGWLADRMPASRLAVIVMAVPMLATLVIYAGGGLWVSIAAGGLLGLCSGGDNSVSLLLARRYFSAETFGRASATQMVAAAAGGGVSPWLAGVVHDRTGSYDLALIMAAACMGAAALAAWWLPEQRVVTTDRKDTVTAGA
ncbi:MAG: MFS transporter [Rubrivivax sp.]|jgi:MFS family permease|nr:MFS transporter [Rubrivivax sp.]